MPTLKYSFAVNSSAFRDKLACLSIIAVLATCCDHDYALPTHPSTGPAPPPGDPNFSHPCTAATISVASNAADFMRPPLARVRSSIPRIRAVSNYAGSWSGQYRVTGCFRQCGLGPDVCKTYLSGGGYILQLRTTLTQNGTTVSGTLDIFDTTGSVVVETGRITGMADDSNALVLSGTVFSISRSEPPSQTTITDWSTALTNDGNSMTGRFTQNWNFTNAWGPQHVKMDCELVSFQRSR